MSAGAEEALDFSMKKSTTVVVKEESCRNLGSPNSSDGSSQSPSSTTPAGGHSAAAAFNMFSAAAAQALPSNLSSLLGHSAVGFQPFAKKTLCPTPPFFGGTLNSGPLGDPFSPPSAPWMPSPFTAALSPTPGSSNFAQSIPDPAFFPTASLAMSTIHRRRKASCTSHPAGSPSQNVDATRVVGSPARSSDEPEPKRPAKGVPDDLKDEQYWERRRKNNEAAKRSRDSRRAKEEEIAMRAALLEQENLKLRAQVAVLKNETAKLHFMLFSQVQQNPGGQAAGGSTPNSNHGHHILA